MEHLYVQQWLTSKGAVAGSGWLRNSEVLYAAWGTLSTPRVFVIIRTYAVAGIKRL
jgi:hypothetical protein